MEEDEWLMWSVYLILPLVRCATYPLRATRVGVTTGTDVSKVYAGNIRTYYGQRARDQVNYERANLIHIDSSAG